MRSQFNKFLPVVLFLFLPCKVLSQWKSNIVIHNDDSLAPIWYSLIPTITTGTHINGLGGDLMTGIKLVEKKKYTLSMHSRSGSKFFVSYLGISGSSLLLEQQFELGLSWGALFKAFSFRSENLRRHNLSYYFIGYYATDKTSQLSGGLKYKYHTDNIEINFVFENDFLAFLLRDEYRTFAAELNSIKQLKNNSFGVGTGIILWTGTTQGLGFLSKGQVYDMSRQYGGTFSSGIAYIKLYYNNMWFSMGYDSEGIRAFVQDSFHDLIDDGRIPSLNRKGRIYVQFSIWDFGSLY